jgi:glutamate/tyrosine decarboxylase-like PLP-dependent enzyme
MSDWRETDKERDNMEHRVNPTLQTKVDSLNNEFFIGEEGTSYGGYYDYCLKYLRMVDQFQENRIPEIDMAGVHEGIRIPRVGSLKSAGATLLPFYESPYFRGGLDWRNVIPGTAVPGIIFSQASKITNSNLAHSKYGGRASELELRMSAALAQLVGYDSRRSAGIFVAGGTKANLYGYVLGLRKAFPDSARTGIISLSEDIRFVNSQAGHFSNLTNLALLGAGTDRVISVPSNEDGSVDLAMLEETLVRLKQEGLVVPTIMLTVGTTDTFGADDVRATCELRDGIYADSPRKPHVHADAAIGWAMCFFNEYDFDENIHGFDESIVRRLRERQDLFRSLRFADSVTLDFHKTGYTPYSASMVLIRDQDDLQPLTWGTAMFRYFDPKQIEIAPVQYTLECSRSPEAVFSVAGNMLSFGIEGYQICLGWAIQVSDYLRDCLDELGHVGIVNRANDGFSTVFRVYRSGTNGPEELRRELTDASYRERMMQNSQFSYGLFNFRNARLTVRDPKLDYTRAATWARYDRKTEVPAWKAYILNPRVRYTDVDRFVDSLRSLTVQYEERLAAATSRHPARSRVEP